MVSRRKLSKIGVCISIDILLFILKLTYTGPMIKLALPGLLMVEAEFLAFE
jgi:hypothetical protein